MSTLAVITINLHCLEEMNIEENKKTIVDEIMLKNVDVIFLQEVAQYDDRPMIDKYIKKSNYGYDLQQLLRDKGEEYHYIFHPIKSSFNKYDEGLGILSKYPLANVEAKYISKSKDYSNWKSRKYLKATIQLKEETIDLYTVHLGWDSTEELYIEQCKQLLNSLSATPTLIGGDFNVACGSNYYQQTVEMGLIDLYGLDEEKKYDATFEDVLDVHKESARIDYIFASSKFKVLEQEIIFKKPMVSDHYGIYMKIEV